MIKKVLTGLLLAGAIIAAVALAPFWVLGIILAVFVTGAAWEFAGLAAGRVLDSVVTAAGALALVAASFFLDGEQFGMVAIQAVFLAGMIGLMVVLLSPAPIESAGRRAAMVVAGIVYVGLAGALCLRLFRPEQGFTAPVVASGRWALLVAAMITWMNDTLAYFGGRLFGKSKMYPLISPNKTWAGSISGMVGSVGGAFLVTWLLRIDYPPLPLLALSLIGGALGQAGDLVESLFKRSAGVKDSGNLFPGHGGMLDRIDAFLFVGPFTWAWLYLWFPLVR